MKKNVWTWIFGNLIELIILFAATCVMYKLILKKEDWLYMSIVWSISYMVGYFIKPFFIKGKTTSTDNIAYIIGFVLICFIATAFVVGVLLDMTPWFSHVWRIVFPFTVALIIGKSGPLEKDEEKQEDDENKKDKDEEIKVKILD